MLKKILSKDIFELAKLYGIQTQYRNTLSKKINIDIDVIKDILQAFGVCLDDKQTIRQHIRELHDEKTKRSLPTTIVKKSSEDKICNVTIPSTDEISVWIELEDGGNVEVLYEIRKRVDDSGVSAICIALQLTKDLPIGYHTMYIKHHAESCLLIVTPDGSLMPRFSPAKNTSAEYDGSATGLIAHFYATRMRDSWGVGDIADLTYLVNWSAAHRLAFVAIQPMHAQEMVSPYSDSPYFSVSRRFCHPMYIHIERIPEYQLLSMEDKRKIHILRESARGNESEFMLDREASWTAKFDALMIVYQLGLTQHRQKEFDEYRAKHGETLINFATWSTLAEKYSPLYCEWPVQMQHPNNPEVVKFRKENQKQITFYMWLQWILNFQMKDVQANAKRQGMGIGIIHDLAVGTRANGADSWMYQHVLMNGMTVGAPPDDMTILGQDWNQPPWNPFYLEENKYQPFRDIVRANMQHCGAIRIDHIMGLFRLWCIPKDQSPDKGAYITYDHEAMFGIVCIEAYRAGVIVIGEDLGTIDKWMQTYMAEMGVLSTSVLWFELKKGKPRVLHKWKKRMFVSVAVHDIAPVYGYIEGIHFHARQQIFGEHVSWRYFRTEMKNWKKKLRAHKFLHRSRQNDPDAVVNGLYRYLFASNSQMKGIYIQDVVGDRRLLNLPGTDTEYPNWCCGLSDYDGKPVYLEDLPHYLLPGNKKCGKRSRALRKNVKRISKQDIFKRLAIPADGISNKDIGKKL